MFFLGQAVKKGIDFSLLPVIQVGHNVLEVCIVGYKLAVGLVQAVELTLCSCLSVRVTLQGLKQGNEFVDLVSW